MIRYTPSRSLPRHAGVEQASSWLASSGVVLRAGLGWVFELGVTVDMPIYKKNNLKLVNRASFLGLLLALPGTFTLMLMGFSHTFILLVAGVLLLCLVLALNGARLVEWAQGLFAFSPALFVLAYSLVELSGGSLDERLPYLLVRQAICFLLLVPVLLYGFEESRTVLGVLAGCVLIFLGFDVGSMQWGSAQFGQVSGLSHGLFSLLSLLQLVGLAACVLYIQGLILKHQQQVDSSNNLLKTMVVKDGMTNLYNHSYMEQLVGDAINRSNRSGTPLSLLMIDIDGFKQVNDIFGHNAGDEVLVSLGKLLENNKRSTDYLGRWGGDELILLLTDTNLAGALNLAGKLRSLVDGHAFPHLSRLTISLGASEFQHSENTTSFIARADAALYRAKRAGRNRVELDQP